MGEGIAVESLSAQTGRSNSHQIWMTYFPKMVTTIMTMLTITKTSTMLLTKGAKERTRIVYDTVPMADLREDRNKPSEIHKEINFISGTKMP
jgi:hypothetical protein